MTADENFGKLQQLDRDATTKEKYISWDLIFLVNCEKESLIFIKLILVNGKVGTSRGWIL